jgi:hypothetical protein
VGLIYGLRRARMAQERRKANRSRDWALDSRSSIWEAFKRS